MGSLPIIYRAHKGRPLRPGGNGSVGEETRPGTRIIHQARKMGPAGALAHAWGIQSRPTSPPAARLMCGPLSNRLLRVGTRPGRRRRAASQAARRPRKIGPQRAFGTYSQSMYAHFASHRGASVNLRIICPCFQHYLSRFSKITVPDFASSCPRVLEIAVRWSYLYITLKRNLFFSWR